MHAALEQEKSNRIIRLSAILAWKPCVAHADNTIEGIRAMSIAIRCRFRATSRQNPYSSIAYAYYIHVMDLMTQDVCKFSVVQPCIRNHSDMFPWRECFLHRRKFHRENLISY